jgi:hypothetical protein
MWAEIHDHIINLDHIAAIKLHGSEIIFLPYEYIKKPFVVRYETIQESWQKFSELANDLSAIMVLPDDDVRFEPPNPDDKSGEEAQSSPGPQDTQGDSQ